MKENIYTIPLNDSFDNTELCPFCYLEDKLEREGVEYALGPSMMEPDSREESNKKGFCRNHMAMMMKESKKLSLALMLSTHLEYVKEQTEKIEIPEKGGFLKKGKEADISELKKCSEGCVICEKIDYHTKRYIDVFHYMCKKEPEFAAKADKCTNLCLRHAVMLLEGASAEQTERVKNMLSKTLSSNIPELKAFIDMFDYRNKQENGDMHREAVKNAAYSASGSLENM